MMTDTEYQGKTYTVPETGARENFDSMLREVPDDDHAMAFLMQDGNLGVPGGRYGNDTASCAPVALAVAKIIADGTGEPITYYSLDHDMGLVVNSSDDVAYTIREHGPTIGIDPEDYLDGDDLESDDD